MMLGGQGINLRRTIVSGAGIRGAVFVWIGGIDAGPVDCLAAATGMWRMACEEGIGVIVWPSWGRSSMGSVS